MFEFDRTVGFIPLSEAWNKVRKKNSTAGVDQIDVAFYQQNETENLEKLHYALVSSRYMPYGEKSYSSTKSNRQIYISSLEDKIV